MNKKNPLNQCKLLEYQRIELKSLQKGKINDKRNKNSTSIRNTGSQENG